MRIVLRRAALLLAAAGFGLVRPAPARSEGAVPLVSETTDEEPDDTPALPRVLPLRRPASQPMKQTPPAAAAHAAPAPTLAATAPTQSAVNLLAPPGLPAQWSQPPNRLAPTVAATLGHPAPAGYPASMTPAPPAAHAPNATSPIRATPAVASDHPSTIQPHPAEEAVPPARTTPAAAIIHLTPIQPHPAATKTAEPPPQPTPAVASDHPAPIRPHPVVAAAPVAPPSQPAPAKHVWPAAFVTKETADEENKGAAFSEMAKAPAPAAARPAEDLGQRVMALCGRDAVGVVVSKQPNGGVVVRVRVREPGTEQKMMEKILKIPEMTRPTVRLVLDPGP